MKVHVGNIVAEVENERDIELLRKLITSTPAVYDNGISEQLREPAESKPTAGNQQEIGSFEMAVTAWRERLRSEAQGQLVDQLASELRWFGGDELCAALGFSKIGQLSGVLCGISRHAKAVKLKPVDIIQKRMTKTPEGEREHSYRLSPKAQQVLERIKGENQMT